jgi:uncharacterized protein (DUF433 family)
MAAVADTARITINPNILGGKPAIRGTRISVELILRDLAEGASVEDLLEAYPSVSEADVRAAIAYAADTIAAEETIPVAVSSPARRKTRR